MRISDSIEGRGFRHRAQAEQVLLNGANPEDTRSLYRVLSDLPTKVRDIPADAWRVRGSGALPDVPATHPGKRSVFSPVATFELELPTMRVFANKYSLKGDMIIADPNGVLPRHRYEVGAKLLERKNDVVTFAGEVAEAVFHSIERHRTDRITKELALRVRAWGRRSLSPESHADAAEISAAHEILNRYHIGVELLFGASEREAHYPRTQAGWIIVEGDSGSRSRSCQFRDLRFPSVIENIIWAPTLDQATAYLNRRTLDCFGQFMPCINLSTQKLWFDDPGKVTIRVEPYDPKRLAALYDLMGF